ncbi:hypothetical protein [Enhygromyxa salina]|uniref:Uncharacterized protein n=1 Tax=Enhygromyxa salina TaxID=215803 RepID=A0A2S9YMJ5_9BACT|nr:hypothetical protein [Enhygromyxa salina]PRQ06309.1 hypothetical protein ENSA7_39860 [Enhygromyxa salina]
MALLVAPACDEGDDGSDEQAASTEGDGDGDGDGDGESGGKHEGDGDTSESETTGELMGCAVHETQAACMAEAGCGAIFGNPVVEDGEGSYCTQSEKTYIGCVFAGDLCPMLPNILCSEDAVWTSSGCVPENVMICESPGEITGACA